MASSFIKYKEKGFWINDTLLEPVCGIFYICLQNDVAKGQWHSEFRKLTLSNTVGAFNAHMHLNFDEFILSEEHKKWMLNLFENARKYIIEKGNVINCKFIEEEILPHKHYVTENWDFEVQTFRILKIVDYLELLIYEKLNIKDSDKIFYSF